MLTLTDMIKLLRCFGLNRESRESRERSRRCNPVLPYWQKTFLHTPPLSGPSRMGRPQKSQGSQKTCLSRIIGACGDTGAGCLLFISQAQGNIKRVKQAGCSPSGMLIYVHEGLFLFQECFFQFLRAAGPAVLSCLNRLCRS
jgi:hypothetical protein